MACHPVLFCAAKEIRTPMPLRALPPQGSASTNFAIAATGLQINIKNRGIKLCCKFISGHAQATPTPHQPL